MSADDGDAVPMKVHKNQMLGLYAAIGDTVYDLSIPEGIVAAGRDRYVIVALLRWQLDRLDPQRDEEGRW